MTDLDRLFFSGIAFGAGCALAWFGIAGVFEAINRARIRREIDTRQEARRREAEAKIALEIRREQEEEKRQWPEEIEV